MTGPVSHACNGEAHHDSIGGRGGGSKLSLRSMGPDHPLLEGVGALTIPRDGPVGIPLALAAAFAFRACEHQFRLPWTTCCSRIEIVRPSACPCPRWRRCSESCHHFLP